MRNPPSRSFLQSFLVRLIFFALLWVVLSEGDHSGWIVGAPVVLALAWRSDRRLGEPAARTKLRGALAFVPYFLKQSIASGVDVALRAFRPDMGLEPALLRYPLRLPEGLARNIFINTITLMPGTLSASLEEEELIVHVLDARMPNEESLSDLEDRVACAFDLSRNVEAS